MGGGSRSSLKENAPDFSALIPSNLVFADPPPSICTLFWSVWFSSFLYAFPYLYGYGQAFTESCILVLSFLLFSQLDRPKMHSSDSLPWLCLVFLTQKSILGEEFVPKIFRDVFEKLFSLKTDSRCSLSL